MNIENKDSNRAPKAVHTGQKLLLEYASSKIKTEDVMKTSNEDMDNLLFSFNPSNKES